MPLTSTASKSLPFNDFSAFNASLLHLSSWVPDRNQEEPLSAMIAPCRLSASATTRAWAGNRDTSTDAFNRNQAPIGGSAGSVDDDAACRAGHTNFFCVRAA